MEHHVNWGLPVALDLFLAAMGAGAFLLAVACDFAGGRKYRLVSTVGALVAPWPAILGVLLLVIDLGNPFRFWEMMVERSHDSFLGINGLMFNPGSPMSYGTWFLSLFVIVSLCYIGAALVAWPFKWGEIIKRLVGLAGVPFALLVMVYTGVLLSASPNPVWGTMVLPVVFVISAVVTGIASVTLVLAALRFLNLVEEETAHIPKLEKLTRWLIVVQLASMVLLTILLAKAGVSGSPEAWAVIGGQYGFIWWAGAIGLGLIVPLIAGFKAKAQKPEGSAVVAALILLGGFFLRYVLLMSGQIV